MLQLAHRDGLVSALVLALRQLSATEVEPAHRVMREAAVDLVARHGKGPWENFTPIDTLEHMAATRFVGGVFDGAEVVAAFSLRWTAPAWYDLSLFRYPEDPAAYLFDFAVTPARQGQGIGRWCMQQIDALAIAHGCDSLRFDAYDAPAGAGPFYRKLGYHLRGHMVFNRVPLLVFEKTFRSQSRRTRPTALVQ